MLTEFAFTPSIFDENAHDDKDAWRDQLRELGRNMFPRVSACPIVVSDLYDGSWNAIADQTVKAITDQRVKLIAEGLLQKMKESRVPRPICGDWPDDDVAWGREAISACDSEPIERIVADTKSKLALIPEFKLIRSLEEVEDAGFWQGIASDASPRMMIAEQVALLRKLCLHSQWVAIINPYGFGNELDFTIGLLELILRRDPKFGPLHVELHARSPDVVDVEMRKERESKMANHMARQIQPKVERENRVALYFWPTLLDRILVAGTYVNDSHGIPHKSPRWGVSMSHVAHRDEPEAAPTEWKLLQRDALNSWFRRFVAEDIPSKQLAAEIPYK